MSRVAVYIGMLLVLGVGLVLGFTEVRALNSGLASRVDVQAPLTAEEREALRNQRIQDQNEKRELQAAEREEQYQERLRQRCELAEPRIQKHVRLYEGRTNAHIEWYEKLKARIERHLAKFESNGCDTSAVRNDLDTLDDKLVALRAAYGEFAVVLEGSQRYACGQNDKAYRDAVLTAKEQFGDIKKAAIEVRNFVRTTLKTSLQRQAQLCRESATTDAL